MHFRRIEQRDRAAYLKMAHDFYHSPAVVHPVPGSHLERTFAEMLTASPYVEGFIPEAENGQPMGYALVAKTFSQEAGGLTVWIEELYVLPEYQGLGVGSAMLRELEGLWPHCRRFRLEAEADNEGALRLYRRMGFEPLGYLQLIKDVPEEPRP